MQRVHIAQQVHGRQMHNSTYEADRINVSVSGDGLATLTIDGAPPDPDGWALVYAAHTGVVYATKHMTITPTTEGAQHGPIN